MKRVLAALLCAACASGAPGVRHAAAPAPPGEVAAAAAEGVTDARLRDLLARHWDWMVRRSPSWASHLGEHRFDAELGDFGPAGYTAARAATHAFLAEAQAIHPEGLDESDRTTRALLVEMLTADAGLDDCAPETWRVSARENALVWAVALPDDLIVKTIEDGQNLVARYLKLPAVIDGMAANLRIGAAAGKTASAEVLRRTVTLLDGELAHPAREWGLFSAAVHWHEGWSGGDEVSFAGAIQLAIDEGVRPAVKRYRDALVGDVLPRAPRVEGLSTMPGGAACYRALIRFHTTLDRSPEELHALGLAEIARIDAEMTALGRKVLGTTDLGETLARLRSDKALLFETPDEIMAVARHALAGAEAAVPQSSASSHGQSATCAPCRPTRRPTARRRTTARPMPTARGQVHTC